MILGSRENIELKIMPQKNTNHIFFSFFEYFIFLSAETAFEYPIIMPLGIRKSTAALLKIDRRSVIVFRACSVHRSNITGLKVNNLTIKILDIITLYFSERELGFSKHVF